MITKQNRRCGMVKSADCLKKYGDPEKQKAMVLWDVPAALEIGVIPKRAREFKKEIDDA